METVNIPSCPVCGQAHTVLLPAETRTATLTCPATGTLYQGEIQRTITALPLPRFAKLHQGVMPVFA